jgi:hypothetical protein
MPTFGTECQSVQLFSPTVWRISLIRVLSSVMWRCVVYQTAQRHVPEGTLHSNCCESLKSQYNYYFSFLCFWGWEFFILNCLVAAAYENCFFNDGSFGSFVDILSHELSVRSGSHASPHVPLVHWRFETSPLFERCGGPLCEGTGPF